MSDFKRGMVQEQQSRQTGRLEKQEQRKKNIADKRMELQKAQEARQRKTDGSATTGATRPHERPVTASTIPKPSAEKMQEVKRPATATTSKASEPVKTNVVKERPLSLIHIYASHLQEHGKFLVTEHGIFELPE